MVEEIKKLSAELQAHRLPERKNEVLNRREICVHKTRSGHRCASSVPEFPTRSLGERTWIEPVLYGMDLRRAIRSSGFWTRSVGISDLIWTIQHIPIPHEVHARGIAAIHDEQRESGSSFLDDVDLPASKNRIGSPIPCAAELLTFPERQVVQHTGRELVI